MIGIIKILLFLCVILATIGCETKIEDSKRSADEDEVVRIAVEIARQENIEASSCTAKVSQEAQGGWNIRFWSNPPTPEGFFDVIFWPDGTYKVITGTGVYEGQFTPKAGNGKGNEKGTSQGTEKWTPHIDGL